MSQSGFEMFSNVAGMVIVIADVIFFYALWNIFCKNKKEKMSMMIGSVLLLLNIGLGFISSLPTSGRLIISAIAILSDIKSIARNRYLFLLCFMDCVLSVCQLPIVYFNM